jgi:hypothetical protein
MMLQLADITADQRAQPRTAILPARVEEYAEDMRRGDKFEPMVVFREGGKYWLADGFHRYYAAQSAGLKGFDCYVKDGTLRDAVLYSCSANAAHGLRRTNDDKRRAAAKLLEDAQWSKWSDEEIARHCAVSRDFVRRVRKEVAAFSPALKAGERRYVTKHGTESTMKLPAKAPEKPVEGELVAKWLGEIERLMDRMPEDPIVAVRAFPELKRALFPLSKVEWMATWLGDFAVEWRRIMEGNHEG